MQPMTAPTAAIADTCKSIKVLSLSTLLIFLIIISIILFYGLDKEVCCMHHCSPKHKANYYYCCCYDKCFHFISWCLSFVDRLGAVLVARSRRRLGRCLPAPTHAHKADSCNWDPLRRAFQKCRQISVRC